MNAIGRLKGEQPAFLRRAGQGLEAGFRFAVWIRVEKWSEVVDTQAGQEDVVVLRSVVFVET